MQRDFLQRGDRDNLQNLVQSSGQAESLLSDGDQQIGADGRPDLDGDAVGMQREESSQTEVLLNPAKEQLDLPASLVDAGHGQGRKIEVVGDENERLAGGRIVVADAAQGLGIGLAGVFGIEPDGLVATQAGGLVDAARHGHVETHVASGSGDEPSARDVDATPACIVAIAPVENIVATGGERNLVEEVHVVLIGRAERAKGRQLGVDGQHDVKLHRRLRALPARPREQRQAQLDQRRIDGEKLGRQTRLQWTVRIESSCPAHQHHGQFRKQGGGTPLVGVGQVAALDRTTNARVIKGAGAREQTGLDVAQTLSIGQLRKDHHREVIVGRQRLRVPRHRMPLRAAAKLFRVHPIENLGQDRFAVSVRPGAFLTGWEESLTRGASAWI